MSQPTDEEITNVLRSAKTVAVVGLSSDRMRASNGIARFLQRSGYTVIPVNPNETEVLGAKSYASLMEVPIPIDIVDVFRRPEHLPEIARQAVAIKAKVLWMQLGIQSAEAAATASSGGLLVIENRCIMIEHMRLAGAA
jgi:predicted CoA-binding protein